MLYGGPFPCKWEPIIWLIWYEPRYETHIMSDEKGSSDPNWIKNWIRNLKFLACWMIPLESNSELLNRNFWFRTQNRKGGQGWTSTIKPMLVVNWIQIYSFNASLIIQLRIVYVKRRKRLQEPNSDRCLSFECSAIACNPGSWAIWSDQNLSI